AGDRAAGPGAGGHLQPPVREHPWRVAELARADRGRDALRDARTLTVSRLLLLAASPRVPAGLLSRDAWRALDAADRVLAADAGEPLPVALGDDGITVTALEDGTAPERARSLVDLARGEDVVWVGSADGDPGLSDAIADEVTRVEE